MSQNIMKINNYNTYRISSKNLIKLERKLILRKDKKYYDSVHKNINYWVKFVSKLCAKSEIV